MPTFEITKVDPEPQEWTGKFGPMHSYKVVAAKPEGGYEDYEVNRKPTSGPPPLGPVEAEIIPSKGDYPDKLKLVQQGGSGGFSGRPDDPERRRRIERQHSQEMALRLLALATDRDEVTYAEVKEVTDWFQKDLEADGGGGDDSLSNQSQSPNAAAASSGFASQKQSGMVEGILKREKVDSNKVEAIKRFMETLDPTALRATIDALAGKDAERRDQVIAALLRKSDEYARSISDVPWDDEQ